MPRQIQWYTRCWKLWRNYLYLSNWSCHLEWMVQIVNKAILGKLDEKKKEKGFKPLARYPVSCLIHVRHNSFCKGVKQYGDNAEELCMDLYYFLNNPCRREDLFEIEETLELEELVLLCHTQCRWLSLIPFFTEID